MNHPFARRVLVTGISGLTGTALARTRPSGVEIRGTFLSHSIPSSHGLTNLPLDIRDEAETRRAVESTRPEIVIHTASIGDVDEAERSPEPVRDVNLRGLGHLVEACRAVGAALIHLSSNAVYDGAAPPYDEGAPRRPVNEYGRIKVACEDLLRSSEIRWAIVRPNLLYGRPSPGGRGNLVTWCLAELRAGREIRVVDDVRSNPAWSDDLAAFLWRLAEVDRWGESWNFGGGSAGSRHDLALAVSEVFGLDPAGIRPVPNSYFPGIAPRPLDTTFDIAKVTALLGSPPLSMREGLLRMR